MGDETLSIGDLADAAGLSRRAIRFYVQQRLLPPPQGRGRGRHYGPPHLNRLRRIQELQQAGHSLDAIRRILDGNGASAIGPRAPLRPARLARSRPALTAELWTRLRVADGVEIHFDAARHNPEIERLMELRDLARDVFAVEPRTTKESPNPRRQP